MRNSNIIKFHFKEKSNGLPILSKKEIDAYAEALVSDFKPELLKQPSSIPIDEFIELYLNLSIDYKNLSTDGNTLGMIAFNDGYVEVYDDLNNKELIEVDAGTIFIDNSLISDEKQQGRCRFTFAHEPGHWIFHRHMYTINKNQMSLFNMDHGAQKVCHKCLKKHVGNMGKIDYFLTDEDWQEWQADYFASAILMPKKTFHMAVENYMKKVHLKPKNLKEDALDNLYMPVRRLFGLVAQTFDVSRHAAAMRMYKLGYISYDLMKLHDV